MEESFFEKVYSVVRQIPAGRVCTYGAIAECIGSKKAARMVGWALNHSHTVYPELPAHRVVNRKGLLSGKHHFDGPSEMEKRLELEGIRVENNQVLDFEALLWDPNKEY
ncbi:MAG: MGMT family protein [Chitinophagales bacterium]|nr:MGMT family protein [Chitinophagales bacterium]